MIQAAETADHLSSSPCPISSNCVSSGGEQPKQSSPMAVLKNGAQKSSRDVLGEAEQEEYERFLLMSSSAAGRTLPRAEIAAPPADLPCGESFSLHNSRAVEEQNRGIILESLAAEVPPQNLSASTDISMLLACSLASDPGQHFRVPSQDSPREIPSSLMGASCVDAGNVDSTQRG
jgi:hypothetical protein